MFCIVAKAALCCGEEETFKARIQRHSSVFDMLFAHIIITKGPTPHVSVMEDMYFHCCSVLQ